jgi:predicted amidophosphoribosyltransferase
MMKYALFEYTPKRFLSRATFEQQDISRMILGFKDGRNVYTRWAAREVSRTLAAMDLRDTVLVCLPASTRSTHVRRWKRFSQLVCRYTGMQNGFDRVQVSGSRKRAHVTGDYELCTNIKHYVHIDADWFRGKKVLVIDDIYTTGQSSSAFIDAMQAVGADVLGALFLGRTRLFRKADRY